MRLFTVDIIIGTNATDSGAYVTDHQGTHLLWNLLRAYAEQFPSADVQMSADFRGAPMDPREANPQWLAGGVALRIPRAERPEDVPVDRRIKVVKPPVLPSDTKESP